VAVEVGLEEHSQSPWQLPADLAFLSFPCCFFLVVGDMLIALLFMIILLLCQPIAE